MKQKVCRSENSVKCRINAYGLLYSFLYVCTSQLELVGQGWIRQVAIFVCPLLKELNGVYAYLCVQKTHRYIVEGNIVEGENVF